MFRTPLLLPAALLLPCPASSQEAKLPQPERAAFARQMRAAMAQACAQTGATAVMLAVVVDGKPYFTHALGKADGKEQPVDASTLFPMGHCSAILANLYAHRAGLDMEADIAGPIAPLQLRRASGEVLEASLAQVLQDEIRLPPYQNRLSSKVVGPWTLERALRENCFAPARPGHGASSLPYSNRNTLAYGLLQWVAERRSKQPWAELVEAEVARPLGLLRLVADGRRSRHETSLWGFGKGFLGLRTRDTQVYGDIAAAHGAWIDTNDSARLLVALLQEAGGKRSVEQLKRLTKGTVFSNFSAFTDVFPLLRMRTSFGPSHGAFVLYPQFGRAWAGIVNYNDGRSTGLPVAIRKALRKALLPEPPPSDGAMWNTAIGLGGRAARGPKPVPEAEQGAYTTQLKVLGKTRTLTLWVGAKGPTHTQVDEDEKVPLSRERFGKLRLRGRGILPLPGKSGLEGTLVLERHEAGEKTRYTGTLDLEGKGTQMVFAVAFSRGG